MRRTARGRVTADERPVPTHNGRVFQPISPARVAPIETFNFADGNTHQRTADRAKKSTIVIDHDDLGHRLMASAAPVRAGGSVQLGGELIKFGCEFQQPTTTCIERAVFRQFSQFCGSCSIAHRC